MKIITFEISDDIYETLQYVAEQRGTSVEQLARGGAVATARAWSVPLHRVIAQLVGEKLTDADIAAETGLLRARVAKIRREYLRLPPNPAAAPARLVSPRSRKASA
ncbi:MAG: hypothetical protein AB7T06_40125 [Kofleriaceae bacterium]